MIAHQAPPGNQSRIVSAVASDLAHIRERFADADRRMKAAQVYGDAGEVEAAEAERQDALGERHAAGEALADLFLLLFRHAYQYRHEHLEVWLADVLRPELEPIIAALTSKESRQ